jgi:hypothetical protein
VATLEGESLQYAAAKLIAVQPNYELKSTQRRLVSFNFQGSSLAVTGDLPTPSQMSAVISGAACGVVSMASVNCITCSSLDASTLNPADDSIQLIIRGVAVGTAAIRMSIQDVPEISAIQPPAISAAGLVSINTLGNNLGGPVSDILNVTVGVALCSNLRNLTRSRIICTAPPLVAAMSSPALVAVTLRSGSIVELSDGFTFTEPEVFDVEGGRLIASADSSPASLTTITVRGLALGNQAIAASESRREW